MDRSGENRPTLDSAAILTSLLEGKDLPREQAIALMRAIMAGEVPPFRLAGILTALRAKGETVAEIAGFARVMREGALGINPDKTGLLDTCSTGGDGSGRGGGGICAKVAWAKSSSHWSNSSRNPSGSSL